MATSNEFHRLCRTRVLLACGDPELADSIRGALRSAGFTRVLTVANGEAVIREIGRASAEVLLTTVELPEISAWQLIRLIRSGDYGPMLPAVILHGGDESSVIDAMARVEGVPAASWRQRELLMAAIAESRSPICKPTLLGIEDDIRAAGVIRDTLSQDFDVEIANDGESGLEAWNSRRHRLVVLDYMLPGMTGIEVLAGIRTINHNQPIVILTGHATPQRRHDFIFGGAAEFLAKPYRIEDLRAVCTRILRHAEFADAKTAFQGTLQKVEEVFAADTYISDGRVQMAADRLKAAVLHFRDRQ